MIWFSSDPHFCHQKDFLWGPRGYADQYEMNKDIIKNWNERVQPNDDVYLLGDIMLNDNEEGLKCLKALKGRIHIVLGNHDSKARAELYKSCYNVVEVERAIQLKAEGYTFYLTHYPTLTDNFDEENHKPLGNRVINLCGHSHTKDKFKDMDKGLIYHVEFDAHDNAPVDIKTVIYDIKKYIERKR